MRPNQHAGSLNHIVKDKYGMSVKDLLIQFAKDGLTSVEVAKKLNVARSTVNNYARRYGIKLKNPQKSEQEKLCVVEQLSELRKTGTLNATNLLNVRW
jgi:transposase